MLITRGVGAERRVSSKRHNDNTLCLLLVNKQFSALMHKICSVGAVRAGKFDFDKDQ
jgi:hypothetical protein